MDLTIVCPAYGREAFTRRFVDHASKLPFLIELDECGWTLPVDQYFTAVRDSVHRVNTPYAMLCDNDDLPTIELGRCMEFLDFNTDYVCCSGRIKGFYLWPDTLTGPRSAVTGQYSPYDMPADYGQDTANQRVLAGFANSWSYYGVYRTDTLKEIWHGVCALELTNLQVHEKFCAMRTLTLGKAKCLSGYTTMYRQHGTSQGAAWRPPGMDMLKVLKVMEVEGIDPEALTRAWVAWYEKRDRYFRSPWRKAITKIAQSRYRWFAEELHV